MEGERVMGAEVISVESAADIAACWPAFSVLRPTLDFERYVAQVGRQRQQGYRIIAVRVNGLLPCVAGFRPVEYLAWGKAIYIDDLSTLPGHRRRGYAAALLDWIFKYAAEQGCGAVHLDSGHTRHMAHVLYLSKGFKITSHHFSKMLGESPAT